MLIIGCDFHTRYQQIAMMDEATGELIERRLEHLDGEARTFYRNLPQPVRVGIEATGPMHWFERLLAELGHELWIGDSAQIRASLTLAACAPPVRGHPPRPVFHSLPQALAKSLQYLAVLPL